MKHLSAQSFSQAQLSMAWLVHVSTANQGLSVASLLILPRSSHHVWASISKRISTHLLITLQQGGPDFFLVTEWEIASLLEV